MPINPYLDLMDLLAHVIRSVVPDGGEEVEDFTRHFSRLQLKTNDYFLQEGAVCNRIGFILSGMIRHYYISEEVETTRWVSTEGEFITAIGSFIPQKPSNHYLQAIVPCDLLVISKRDFEGVYHVNRTVQQLWLRMIEMTCMGFEDRIYMQLSADAEQRYLYMMEKWPQIIEKVPQKYVASMMGVQPESLSRIRAKLQKRIS